MNRSEAAKKRERHKLLREHGWVQWNDLLWYRANDPDKRTVFERKAYRLALAARETPND